MARSAAAAWPREPSLTKSGPDAFRRHAFVRVTNDAFRHAVVESGDPDVLRDWVKCARPLIVRRPCLSDDGREVFLGVSLPGRRRLACRIPVDAVVEVAPPPVWHGDAFQVPGFPLRVFGSHAWQALTGLEYVTPASDLDLLLGISTQAEWEALLARGITLPVHPRIDLEVVFGGDASFHWREFLSPSADILIKSNRNIWLQGKDRLAELLA